MEGLSRKCKICGGHMKLGLVCDDCGTPLLYEDYRKQQTIPEKLKKKYNKPKKGFSICGICGKYGIYKNHSRCLACCILTEEEFFLRILMLERFKRSN